MNIVLRQEHKFLLTQTEASMLINRLSLLAHGDSHNGANGYPVRSLYFDTLNNRDYQEKIDGVSPRKKMRLRIYSPDDPFANLEMKQKQGEQQRKRSLRIKRNDALELTQGCYGSLLSYDDPFALECYLALTTDCYQPRLVVEYRRTAFVAKENNTRITFDRDIRATESATNLFRPNLILYPVYDPYHVILEVKYNGFLVSYLKSIIRPAERSPLAASKYCLGRHISIGYFT